MGESTAARVGRIISGSVNALIDAIENAAPDVVMEQAIREIDEAIDDIRSELGQSIAKKHLASTRLNDESIKRDELGEKIEFAISQGRDDLAEAAISQQLDIEAQLPVLEKSITEFTDREKELEGYIVALQAKKRGMRDELKQLQTSRKASNSASSTSDGTVSSNDNKVDKAISAFERVMEKQSGVGKVENNSNAQTAAKMAELDELSHSNRIQERLNKVKANLTQ